VLQCVAVCCSVLQCDAVDVNLNHVDFDDVFRRWNNDWLLLSNDGDCVCNTPQCTATHCNTRQNADFDDLFPRWNDEWLFLSDDGVLQCVAVCCGVLQCVAVCCSVLQCVAVCCCVLQCVSDAFIK